MIFSLGLLLGLVIDKSRIKLLEQIEQQQNLDYMSIQLQYNYLLTSLEKNKTCSAFETVIHDNLVALDKVLKRILSFRENSQINKKEYNILERESTLYNIRYWFLMQQSKEYCDSDTVSILYFFSTSKCPDCGNQGVILTYFKALFDKNLLVFPLNADLETEENMIKILSIEYNVTSYPTLIIEGKKYEGIVQKSELSRIICANFKTPKPEC